jgi:threonine synthase
MTNTGKPLNQFPPFSYLSHLECSQCGQSFDPVQVQTFCPQCNAPLLARYDLPAAQKALTPQSIAREAQATWRWHALLPVCDPDHIITLGEGDTPIIELPRLAGRLGMRQLFLKDEGRNPTHSFKARGLALAVSKAFELGIRRLVIPTAGNAGSALASYAALAGMQAHIFMPKDTPPANIRQCQLAGAEVTLVDGLISDAAALAKQSVQEGWFDVSTFKEPYRLEGKKVMGFEIAERFGWELPDVIIYPTGGGTGFVGIWKAFEELTALGWLKTDQRPRMVAVQAEGCAPVVQAFEQGWDHCEFWKNAHTIAGGLRVPKSFADRLIMSVLHESHGLAVAVSDEDILRAQQVLSTQEGIFPCPEGASPLAALHKLLKAGQITPDEKVLLLNTGSGLINVGMCYTSTPSNMS